MPALPVPPRDIASAASRHVLWAGGGAIGALGLAAGARSLTDEPNADGSSPGRIDRAEAKDLFSGPTAPTTILPLSIALITIGTLYTKARILLPEKGAQVSAALADAAKGAGVTLEAGEGSKNKSLYTAMGGTLFASLAARVVIFGDDQYETRHVPKGE